MSKERTNLKFIVANKFEIGCFERQAVDNSDEIYRIRKNHIISPKHELIDIEPEIIKRAMQRTKESEPKYKYDFPQGKIVRKEFRHSSNPLFLIYLLDPQSAGIANFDKPIVGFAISFPESNNSPFVSYSVHSQLLDLFNFDFDENLEFTYED